MAAEVLAVKIEIDTNPPRGAGVEVRLVRRHVTAEAALVNKENALRLLA